MKQIPRRPFLDRGRARQRISASVSDVGTSSDNLEESDQRAIVLRPTRLWKREALTRLSSGQEPR